MSPRSKKELEMVLSQLKSFEKPSLQLEQYATPSSIAAEWVWNMAMKGEVRGKIILDAACGSGILGIGLLLMGAKKVFFLDKDPEAMRICLENYRGLKKKYTLGRNVLGQAEFIVGDVGLFDGEVEIAVQNPPFGTKEEHADKRFLEKAFSISKVVYSMHKLSTKRFVDAISRDFGYKVTDFWVYDFPIKATFQFHQKPAVKIEVGLWRMEKK